MERRRPGMPPPRRRWGGTGPRGDCGWSTADRGCLQPRGVRLFRGRPDQVRRIPRRVVLRSLLRAGTWRQGLRPGSVSVLRPTRPASSSRATRSWPGAPHSVLGKEALIAVRFKGTPAVLSIAPGPRPRWRRWVRHGWRMLPRPWNGCGSGEVVKELGSPLSKLDLGEASIIVSGGRGFSVRQRTSSGGSLAAVLFAQRSVLPGR